MKYVPINEFVTNGNEVYKCIELKECSSCDFDGTKLCYQAICHHRERLDGKSTQFILYDTLEDSDND